MYFSPSDNFPSVEIYICFVNSRFREKVYKQYLFHGNISNHTCSKVWLILYYYCSSSTVRKLHTAPSITLLTEVELLRLVRYFITKQTMEINLVLCSA